MGRELLDRYPVFRSSLFEAGIYLKTLGCPWDLLGKNVVFICVNF